MPAVVGLQIVVVADHSGSAEKFLAGRYAPVVHSESTGLLESVLIA